MELGLEGKVFVVTGGSSGIGAAIVEELFEQNAVPIILDRKAPEADVLARHQSRAPSTDWIAVDLTDDDQCAAAVAEAMKRTGKIDGLVNNAGVNDAVGLDARPADFRASLDRNLVHYYTMAHLCLPALKTQGGSIVNISSKVVLTGQGGTSAYAAAKGGVLALTREWAAELASDGVRVNAVIPGETMTPMYQAWLKGFENPDEKLAGIVRNIPLGARMTKPVEIATSVVFLLSDWAGHTTGQMLVVDGGYSHLDRALTL
ncbi:MAG: SDR family oxidoreductase [Hyphomicrobiales bacterium]|nr:SDR family oxidoreductase [Hyphomicrobiales bacterium]